MKRLALIFLAGLLLCACGHRTGSSRIKDSSDMMMAMGKFAGAEELIHLKMAAGDLSPREILDLQDKIEVMHRIRKDFPVTRDEVLDYIRDIYPGVTPEEIARWEDSGALECMFIDDRKMYFRSAGRNLFRIDTSAQKHWNVKGRQSTELDDYLKGYLAQVVAGSNPAKVENTLLPQRYRIRYAIKVKPDEVPDGETVRVWMPYPRANGRSGDIRLLSTSQPEYIISPDSYVHKSIYMEGKARKGEACEFGYELEVTAANQWYGFSPEDVKPYDTTAALYRKYTAERSTHVIFTDDIRHLTDSIVGQERNPYLKARRIFDHIARNYPWASAREYSTIYNIPQYVLDNRHGDCGQVSLLFITMARYAGIPAKWQSGWMLHPGEVNLHDWAEAYFEGIGWVPVDQSFGLVDHPDDKVHHYYLGGIDAYRYYVNDDFSGDFYPAKTHMRSETVDFQRGEVEWRGENLYFGRWSYDMDVEYL